MREPTPEPEPVSAIPIPHPFSLDTFRAALERFLAARRPGFRLLFIALPLVDSSVTGAVMRRGATYAVLFKENTSRPHQLRIICHEVGHIVLGHTIPTIGKRDIARLVAHRLNLDRLQEINPLERDLQIHDDVEEYEAELFGQELMERIRRETVGLDDTVQNQRIRRFLTLGR